MPARLGWSFIDGGGGGGGRGIGVGVLVATLRTVLSTKGRSLTPTAVSSITACLDSPLQTPS